MFGIEAFVTAAQFHWTGHVIRVNDGRLPKVIFYSELRDGTRSRCGRCLDDSVTPAARVVTGTKKFDHITPVLRDLHWLPVRQRIKYKLAMTVYKCLRGLAPTYLADDCLAMSAIAGNRHLRSARTGTLSVPRTMTTLGMRSFAVAGPVIWNSLPASLPTATLSPLTFARHLKAHLFG